MKDVRVPVDDGRTRGLLADERAVLAVVAGGGVVEPSRVDSLAERADRAEQAVTRALRALERAGVVKVEHRRSGDVVVLRRNVTP